MTKGARPPSPVFLPVVSYLSAASWGLRGSLASSLSARSSPRTMYRGHGTAYRQEGGVGDKYGNNKGLGYDGRPATRRGATATMSRHRR